MGKRKRSLIAGVVLGTQLAAKSLEPSLMRRSSVDQGLVMAGSFVTGYVVGSTVSRVVGLLPVLTGSGALRLMGMASKFVPKRNKSATDKSGSLDETAAWTDAATDVLSSVALGDSLAKGRDSAVTAIASVGVATKTAIDAREAIARHEDAPDPKYLATAVGAAAGAVAVAAVLRGAVVVPGRLARRASGTTGLVASGVQVAVTVGAALGLGYGLKIAGGRVIAAIAAGNRSTEISYAQPPHQGTVTGAKESAVEFTSLGLQGRRLVLEATTTSDIDSVMEKPHLHAPVRVYVGVDSASSIEERVELAIAELTRAGGFDRSTIIAASPAGTGYVNYIMVEACELMARGDVATVAIQYGSLPSMLSMNKVAEASEVFAALIARLRQEIDDNNLEISLYAYGESLGALTGQNGVSVASGQHPHPVDGALWVGTPAGSATFEQLTTERAVPVFDRPSQIVKHIDKGNDLPEATLLNHDNDPVTKFVPSSFYRMPDWLKTSDRGRGVDPKQRWLPGISFWQDLVDTKNAATVVPGAFGSTGHDYRADLATFVQISFGFDDVSDEQMERIETQLRTSEIERSENISKGVVQTA